MAALAAITLMWGCNWPMMKFSLINFGVSQVLWIGLARTLPSQAAAFSLMAVPLVGVLSSALALGAAPRASDWSALVLIALAIASATGLLQLRRRSDNAPR